MGISIRPPDDNHQQGGFPSLPSESTRTSSQGGKTWSIGNPFTQFFQCIGNIWNRAFGEEKTSTTALKTEIIASPQPPNPETTQAAARVATKTLASSPPETIEEVETLAGYEEPRKQGWFTRAGESLAEMADFTTEHPYLIQLKLSYGATTDEEDQLRAKLKSEYQLNKLPTTLTKLRSEYFQKAMGFITKINSAFDRNENDDTKITPETFSKYFKDGQLLRPNLIKGIVHHAHCAKIYLECLRDDCRHALTRDELETIQESLQQIDDVLVSIDREAKKLWIPNSKARVATETLASSPPKTTEKVLTPDASEMLRKEGLLTRVGKHFAKMTGLTSSESSYRDLIDAKNLTTEEEQLRRKVNSGYKLTMPNLHFQKTRVQYLEKARKHMVEINKALGRTTTDFATEIPPGAFSKLSPKSIKQIAHNARCAKIYLDCLANVDKDMVEFGMRTSESKTIKKFLTKMDSILTNISSEARKQLPEISDNPST